MVSNSTQKYIMKAIERSKIAEPYPDSFLEKYPDDIFPVDENGEPLDQRRVTATIAKKTLEKYFEAHPEDSIDNYANKTAQK